MRCEAANADKKEVLEKEHGVLFIIILGLWKKKTQGEQQVGLAE